MEHKALTESRIYEAYKSLPMVAGAALSPYSTTKKWYAGTVIFFAAAGLDTLWLGYIAKSFYIANLREILRLDSAGNVDVIYWGALLVYLSLAFGIVNYVLSQIKLGSTLLSVFSKGAIFGTMLYAFYDFTNVATLNTWPAHVAFFDVLWGAFQCGTITLFGFLFLSRQVNFSSRPKSEFEN